MTHQYSIEYMLNEIRQRISRIESRVDTATDKIVGLEGKFRQITSALPDLADDTDDGTDADVDTIIFSGVPYKAVRAEKPGTCAGCDLYASGQYECGYTSAADSCAADERRDGIDMIFVRDGIDTIFVRE